MNITWGADVPPPINGRFLVVSRNSLKVMEVAGGSTNDGANIQQNTYTNGLNQQWDITPHYTDDGDQSYYKLRAVHSGQIADVAGHSYNNGANVSQQTDDGNWFNRHWFFEYVSNGWFHVRCRWSGKYLDVNGVSTADGANIHQWTGTGGLNQQWRLIPVGESPTDTNAPAMLTGVTATAYPVSVQLSWNASSESDLAGYTVLRATNSGGPYEIVARSLTNNTFTDKSANLQRTYFYVVKAVDRSLNSSANSALVSATPSAGPTLVARYSFDGNANDSSGNANHPIVIAGTPTFVAGRYGSAMDFNGTSRYAMLPAGLFASVANFTIALWVNWDGGDAFQRIFDFGNKTTEYMFLTPSSSSGTMRFSITTSGAGGEQSLRTAAPPIGQWQHVAITRSGNTAQLYINGVLATNGTVTIAPASFNPALNYLGESQFSGDPLFNGRLDDFRIYNHALSATEIGDLIGVILPTLISPGATWRYFDKTNDLGTAWRSNSFNDSTWSNGVARLGYGNDGEVTKVASNRQWTTYFRRPFYVPNPTNVVSLNARLTRDDAAAIYLNGAEVWRDANFAAGTITNQTPALVALGSPDETNWLAQSLSPSSLVAGWNLIAAEVHNQSLGSTDLGFDFELTGAVESVTSPTLSITNSPGGLMLSAPADASYFTLLSATNLTPPVSWSSLTNAPILTNNEWRMTLPLGTNGQRYFRLEGP